MEGITVSGTGSAAASPDTAVVELGVSVLGETVAAAVSQAAEAAGSLIEALKANDVGEASMTTSQYSLNPEYDHRSETPKFLGYRVNNTLTAEVSDVAKVGAIIDGAAQMAGDAVRVNRLDFTIKDDRGLLETAREAAWNDALSKATQLAELAGRTLGPATSITDSVGQPPIPRPFERMAVADSATPIQTGTASVSVTLQVEFSFAD
jgi:uncharacterized protein